MTQKVPKPPQIQLDGDTSKLEGNNNVPPPPDISGGILSSNVNSSQGLSKLRSDRSVNKKTFLIAGSVIVGLMVIILLFFVFAKNGHQMVRGNIEIESKGTGGKVGGIKISKNKDYEANEDENNIKEEVAFGNCQNNYDKLLEINRFDFDRHCKTESVRSDDYKQKPIEKKKQNIILIFDASGSMGGQISGKRKIDIAKEAAKKFIDQINEDKDVSLGIIVYGHKGSNSASQKGVSCVGIDEIYYLGETNAQIAKGKLDSFNATGWTPIASSLQKAKDILESHENDENFILLVSDGKETCGGNPVQAVRDIKNSGFGVKVNVIGFDVGGDDEAQLRAIADAGDGDYFEAKNAYDLEMAFQKHKQKLNEADYVIGQTINNLYDISKIINSYNQCRTMLEKENIAMTLDIYARKLTGNKCEQVMDKIYRQRYNKISSRLEQYYKRGVTDFEKNSIKNKR